MVYQIGIAVIDASRIGIHSKLIGKFLSAGNIARKQYSKIRVIKSMLERETTS